MKQKWLIILLMCISLTGCSSQSQEQSQQSTQSSKPTEEIVETKIESVTPVIEEAPPERNLIFISN